VRPDPFFLKTIPLLIIAALFKSAWFKGFIGKAMVTDYFWIKASPSLRR